MKRALFSSGAIGSVSDLMSPNSWCPGSVLFFFLSRSINCGYYRDFFTVVLLGYLNDVSTLFVFKGYMYFYLFFWLI